MSTPNWAAVDKKLAARLKKDPELLDKAVESICLGTQPLWVIGIYEDEAVVEATVAAIMGK